MAEQIALQPSSTNAYLPFENFGGMHVSHEAGALNLLMLVQHPGFVIVCMPAARTDNALWASMHDPYQKLECSCKYAYAQDMLYVPEELLALSCSPS